MRATTLILLAVLLVSPQAGLAQTPEPPGLPPRTFVDFNLIGAASSSGRARTFTGRFVTFGEAGTSQAMYPRPGRALQLPSIDVGAGYMIGRSTGFGINYSRVSFDDAARLTARVPHPQLFNATGYAEGVTSRDLSRDEHMLALNLVVVPLRTERREARFAGGLSYFWLDAEMVSNVSYSQTATAAPQANTVVVTGFSVEHVRGRRAGFNVGGDYTHFITRLVGIRTGLRFSYAKVAISREPLSKRDQDVRVGGLTFFVGARFRFGN